jgi:molybdenum ABC transporter molybdate-binding protein
MKCFVTQYLMKEKKMRNKILSIALLFVLLVSVACTPQATPTVAVEVPTSIPATKVPATAVPTTVPPTAVPVEERTLTVLAAASLTESFTEMGTLFESQNPGVTVVFSFAGSQALAEQLGQGAEADVFASASKKYMEAAVTSERVLADASKPFVYNRLVVIYPKGNPGGITELKDLAKAGLKLDLADVSVPVGQYSVDFLDKAVADPAFGATFKDDVLKNVVSYEENVKSVLAKVVLGEADAGIVYVTDITADAKESVATIEIPDALNTIATYPIAPISDSKNAELAQAFVDLVLSQEGSAILSKYGFIPASQTASTGFSVTDALGRTVSFTKVPERIVLSGKALFMIADAVYLFPEAGKKIVAIGSTAQSGSDFLPIIDATYSEKTILESGAGAEQIAAAQPDCVILKSSVAESLGAPLEALNIPVVYLDFETFEQYQRDLKTLGDLLQNPAQAQKIADFYTAEVDKITGVVSGVADADKPSVLLLQYSDKDGTVAFKVPPMGWMQTYLVQAAGGIPVWENANLENGWTVVNLEQIAAWNPDVVLVINYFSSVDDTIKLIKADPNWQSLDAVKNDRIYGFAKDIYSWDQPDTRWILGLDWVASKLYPDLFSGMDIVEQAKSFYSEMYAVDSAKFEAEILPKLTGDIN